ncbi:hypothetical protein B0H10DRAFT_2094868 [Mycena sp. CBHHK59/15]|nr:hypothetical protein B0H10DRAFT_2135112 [Mycena sp. CBHHK59/15]KAJ6556723.1 hypothetical protein B0H10DRAFT_2121943 [Mycena sp. CBHHK59/15]KAJ6580581.1 hypothetical protein B0H10DRAFT_2098649 [Mycena sp. CBHHK59/15]KAJ6586654.1 hypothetical protein B0H10DRAFT_2094868 [Mycena sp. CBHHK59/15]
MIQRQQFAAMLPLRVGSAGGCAQCRSAGKARGVCGTPIYVNRTRAAVVSGHYGRQQRFMLRPAGRWPRRRCTTRPQGSGGSKSDTLGIERVLCECASGQK